MKDWEDLVYETSEAFGGNLPHPETAAIIQTAYTKTPTAVIRAIDRVTTDYQDGTIRSPWGVLKSRVQQIHVDQTTTKRGNDKEKAIERARQWLKTAGIHYDRETEIRDELFGERGPLRQHKDDPTVQLMLELWLELRPLGEVLEHEHEARMRRYSEQVGRA